MKQYITHMNNCIELAKLTQGETSPNPLVGCVIINDDDEVIATGYHKKYGKNHAERDALLKLENAKDCTLIVNLEPCSHHGKTPPCTDIIIEKGIKKVVYGMQDPNPIVAGRGLQKLKDAGIEVIGPVLEDECKKLNEVFIKNHTKKSTFIALKTATTIDGKIATHCGDSKWITSEKARLEVRNIRKKYDAILTSSATIIADNPTMEHKKKIILDRELKTDLSSKIYEQGEIYIFYDEKLNPEITNHQIKFQRLVTPHSDAESKKILNQVQNDEVFDSHCKVQNDKIFFIPTPVKNEKLDIKYIINCLYELKIMSVLVEAGGEVNNSILPFVDKFFHFIAPKVLGDNCGKSCFNGHQIDKISDCTNLKFESAQIFEPDILITYTKG